MKNSLIGKALEKIGDASNIESRYFKRKDNLWEITLSMWGCPHAEMDKKFNHLNYYFDEYGIVLEKSIIEGEGSLRQRRCTYFYNEEVANAIEGLSDLNIKRCYNRLKEGWGITFFIRGDYEEDMVIKFFDIHSQMKKHNANLFNFSTQKHVISTCIDYYLKENWANMKKFWMYFHYLLPVKRGLQRDKVGDEVGINVCNFK